MRHWPQLQTQVLIQSTEPEARLAVQAQTPPAPNSHTNTETLPPRPAPISSTTRISIRTHLGHKYTLATAASPVLYRQTTQASMAVPTTDEYTALPPRGNLPPTTTSQTRVCHSSLHRYPPPNLNRTDELTNSETPSMSETLRHLCACTLRR